MTLNKYYITFLISLILLACNSKKQHENAGGAFHMCINSAPSTFISQNTGDVYSTTIMSQVLEGLVTLDPRTLKIKPQLAKTFKISTDGKTFSFYLRDDVFFHENDVFPNTESRKLIADDVIASFENICRKRETGEGSIGYMLIFKDCVKGANDFYEGKAKTISGITSKGNVITIELEITDLSFIQKLAMPNAAIIASEILKANQQASLNGTGPFIYSAALNKNPTKISVYKNTEYYLNDKQGNALPYLDSIVFFIEQRKLEQLEMFEKGEIQFMQELPTSRITEMLEGRISDFNSIPPKFELNDNPQLATQFYFFNMTEERFKDVKVRQAFNYAINKSKIVQNILKGQAYEAGIYGLVPPLSNYFQGYDFKSVKKYGYDYDPIKAKKLFAEAGYPDGKGFGTVDLKVNIGDVHTAVAEEISKQLRQNLNINVNFDGTTFEQKNIDADMAIGSMYRNSWSADYMSPESFLANFYGKYVPESLSIPSRSNQSRYKNIKFDEFYEKGRVATLFREQQLNYCLAEQELMKDPPIIALYYAGTNQLFYSEVRNLHINPFQLFDFREVYFKPWTKEEYQKRIK